MKLICNQTSQKVLQFKSIPTKGQLISKGLFVILNSPKKGTKKIRFYYYDTSGQLVFVRFLGEIETTKKTFRN